MVFPVESYFIYSTYCDVLDFPSPEGYVYIGDVPKWTFLAETENEETKAANRNTERNYYDNYYR